MGQFNKYSNGVERRRRGEKKYLLGAKRVRALSNTWELVGRHDGLQSTPPPMF
jgi:hypothetical protein